jgi:hypothetical protein
VFTLPKREITNNREISATPQKKKDENTMPRKSPGMASAPTSDVEKMRRLNGRKRSSPKVAVNSTWLG